MGPKPYVRLPTPRAVNRPDFPPDLTHFYAHHEAVEFEGLEENRSLDLLPLREVKRIGWAGLDLVGDCPEGWERFDALRSGGGCHFERIVYVIDAPCCPSGSILGLGGELNWGSVGTGSHVLGWGLVLGASFPEWLRHLEEYGWWEHAIGFGIPD